MEDNIQNRKKQIITVNYILSTFILFVVFSSVFCSTKKTSQSIIDENIYIKTEDTKLFANIRGNDSSLPVLLYLHGGPGSPLGIPIFKAYAGHQLERDFIVVYLHQRGIMKSERVADSTHTIKNYIIDIHHVVSYLKNRFKGRQIFLLGHSWGGLLSYLYQLHYKNEINKFVAVCSPLNVKSITYGRIDMIIQWASATNNQQALDELSLLKDKPLNELKEDSKVLKKWMSKAYGGWHRNLDINRVNKAIDYEDNFPDWLKEQKHIESILIDEILNINLTDSIDGIFTPLLCIAGKEDTDAPWYILKDELENYGGDKTFKLFEKSHHLVFIDEEDLFVETIVNFLKTK